ncbi:MAG: peptidase, partial [Planctomycetes bacterium]|nr:peptidase [Planctomycetota bacterium]
MARPDDAELTGLMSQFVCVRVVQANGLDLSLFQFDYDATFAAFFLNADRTIYGRFGTRSAARGGSAFVTADAFKKALRGALRLHADHPNDKAALAGKTGAKAIALVPEQMAVLERFEDSVDFSGGAAAVDASCIHCHQLGTGQALELWRQRQPLTDAVLFPWPMPDRIGAEMRIEADTTIERVVPDSPAARA